MKVKAISAIRYSGKSYLPGSEIDIKESGEVERLEKLGVVETASSSKPKEDKSKKSKEDKSEN